MTAAHFAFEHLVAFKPSLLTRKMISPATHSIEEQDLRLDELKTELEALLPLLKKAGLQAEVTFKEGTVEVWTDSLMLDAVICYHRVRDVIEKEDDWVVEEDEEEDDDLLD